MTQLREQFNKAINFINREGISELVIFLESTDFFTAPASTIYHNNFEGGLLEHCINVLKFALHNFNMIIKEKPEYEYLRESVVLCSIFHDISKCNFYFKTEKWTKDENNKWKSYQGYEVNDSLPLPHGPKSVFLISKFVKLTDAEALAISWHMGQSDLVQPSTMSKYAYDKAFDHPLVKIIHTADLLSLILENIIDYKNIK